MAVSSSYSPKVFKRDGGDAIAMKSGGIAAVDAGVGGFANQIRVRTSTANVNAGATLLPALPGYAYRIHDVTMIAVGGAASGATAVTVNGTQAASGVALLSVAIAALTQSAVNRAGGSNAAVLADGASFASCDANTAITIAKTGGSLATTTFVDVLLTYSIEAQ